MADILNMILSEENKNPIVLRDYDINLITNTGLFVVIDATANFPVAGKQWYLDVFRDTNAVSLRQTAYDKASNNVYSRVCNSGAWTSWARIDNETLSLANVTDLNTLVANGKYSVNDSLNGPTGATRGLLLDVTKYSGGSTNYVSQTAYAMDDGTGRAWRRQFEGTSWGEWIALDDYARQLADGTSINTLLVPGKYYVNAGVNAPETGGIYYDITGIDVLHVLQTATRATGKETYTRTRHGGSWSAWARVDNGLISLTTNTNFNGLTTSGSYWLSTNLNTPDSNNLWFVEVLAADSDWITQRAYNAYNTDTFERRKTAGTWGAWKSMSGADNKLLISSANVMHSANTEVTHTSTSNGAPNTRLMMVFVPKHNGEVTISADIQATSGNNRSAQVHYHTDYTGKLAASAALFAPFPTTFPLRYNTPIGTVIANNVPNSVEIGNKNNTGYATVSKLIKVFAGVPMFITFLMTNGTDGMQSTGLIRNVRVMYDIVTY